MFSKTGLSFLKKAATINPITTPKSIEVKEPKTIFTSDKYRIDKTHFACVVQTKEQREAKADTVYVGEGFTTVWNVNDVVVHQPEIVTTSFGEVHDDLPF